MHKKLFTVLVVALLLPTLFFAQNMKKAPLKYDAPASATERSVTGTHEVTGSIPGFTLLADNGMPNVYGPASAEINPVSYDPASNLLVVVHRGMTEAQGGYSAGSGELWYAYSTDLGATWSRSETSVQNGQTAEILARYPSSAILNPEEQDVFDDIIVSFAWPELLPGGGSFGYLGYAADLGVDGSDFAATTDEEKYSTATPMWTSDNDYYVFWTNTLYDPDASTPADIHLFRTTDYSEVEVIEPEQWKDAAFGGDGVSDFGGSNIIGGASQDGVQYLAVLGTFPELIGLGGWEPGYSKSTDNGDTWSEFKVVDWTLSEATAEYNGIWNYFKNNGTPAYIFYQGDMNVGNDGMVHIVTGMSILDTNDADFSTTWSKGYNALVEYVETDSDVWDAKIICEGDILSDSTFTQYGGTISGDAEGLGLHQMGYSVYLAKDKAGEFWVAQWVTHANSDSFFCDVWQNFRRDAEDWGEPVNITNTPNLNEQSSHLAPTLATDEDSVYAVSFVVYPDPDQVLSHAKPPLTDPTFYWSKKVGYAKEPQSSVEGDLSELDFNLAQNYPNPFNPSTTISYTIPAQSKVSLKVYDMLGAEVATLVNKTQNAGSYDVKFDASQLASGVYVYELSAGQFTNSAKMILMK